MTRTEREELLRRFLDGELDSSQEHDFYINVALDNELRTELKAHQTIDSAIRKDRTIDPMELAPMEMAVASMLTSIPRNTTSPSAPAAMPAAPLPASASGSGQSNSRLSTRWFIGGITALLAIMAVLLVFLRPSKPAPAGAYRNPQQAANPTLQLDTPSNAAVDRSAIAEPNSRQRMQTQTKRSTAEHGRRTDKGTARLKSDNPGVSRERQVQQNTGHQQQTEQADRSRSAPQQYRFSDSTKGEINVQFKKPLPN